jgi:hypothetical protein
LVEQSADLDPRGHARVDRIVGAQRIVAAHTPEL